MSNPSVRFIEFCLLVVSFIFMVFFISGQPSDLALRVRFSVLRVSDISRGVGLLIPSSGLLQGSGKRQRHVKVKKLADVERPEFRELIRQAWERQPDTEVLEDAVQRLREICLAYPDSSEVLSHGHPTFKVGRKSFAVYGIYSPSVAFKADVQLHAELEGDDLFFPTPYMANKGWISIRIDENTNWDRVSELVKHSFAQVASRKQLASLAEKATR